MTAILATLHKALRTERRASDRAISDRDARIRQLEEALRIAQHALTTTHGLWATDRPIFTPYEVGMHRGSDKMTAHINTYWRIDNSTAKSAIDAVLDPAPASD